MTEIFNIIKALFFAYSTVLLLVMVAVIQSDQSRYDKALQPLRDIQTLSASINTKIARSLIEADASNYRKTGQSTLLLPEIQRTIEFSYSEVSVDFDTIPKEFIGSPPHGFDFGRNQIESFPDNFTKLLFVNNIDRPMLKPKTLARYIELHNATLNPVTYTRISPDFSRAGRMEAYVIEKREFNSLENLELIDNGTELIIDGFSLNKDKTTEIPRRCNLTLKRTSLNHKFVYFCNLGVIRIQDIQALDLSFQPYRDLKKFRQVKLPPSWGSQKIVVYLLT